MASRSSKKSSKNKDVKKDVTCLAIGDPHLKNKNTVLNAQYVASVIKVAQEKSPTFIVILGDILDTHDTIKIAPCKVATEELIDGLSKIAPVFLIIGNHDLSDPNQFLTDNHIFNPLKKWRNVTVVDYPRYITIQEKEFVMCPFVQPGRFIEALDKVTESGYSWDLADCIFGHQEFFGSQYGQGQSQIGDKWDEDYPPVISGHLHDEQTLGNVYYPGASMQHSFSESYKKYIWLINFTRDVDESSNFKHFHYEKISLGINRQRMITLNVDEVDDFDADVSDKYRNLKLKIIGTQNEINAFKKSQRHTLLKNKGIIFSYSFTTNKQLEILSSDMVRAVEKISLMSYETLLTKVVETKDELVKSAYNDILAPTLGGFVGAKNDEPEIIIEEDLEESGEFEECEASEEFEESEEYDEYEESEKYENSEYEEDSELYLDSEE